MNFTFFVVGLCTDSVVLLAGGQILRQDAPRNTLRLDLLGRAYGRAIAVERAREKGVYPLPQITR
ncbi:hypothetical protein [Ruegeria hyattellae]|uniref:hypothetical protein n=1 Tax=Ruegeria hyattellae TaxID=3233337 RepID=UPI00355B6815